MNLLSTVLTLRSMQLNQPSPMTSVGDERPITSYIVARPRNRYATDAWAVREAAGVVLLPGRGDGQEAPDFWDFCEEFGTRHLVCSVLVDEASGGSVWRPEMDVTADWIGGPLDGCFSGSPPPPHENEEEDFARNLVPAPDVPTGLPIEMLVSELEVMWAAAVNPTRSARPGSGDAAAADRWSRALQQELQRYEGWWAVPALLTVKTSPAVALDDDDATVQHDRWLGHFHAVAI